MDNLRSIVAFKASAKKIPFSHLFSFLPMLLFFIWLLGVDMASWKYYRLLKRHLMTFEDLPLWLEYAWWITGPFCLLTVVFLIAHALYLRRDGWGIVILKLFSIPVFLFICLLIVFHVD